MANSKNTIMSFHNFPSDLYPDILSRLPAKTLLRFKYVSKLWSSIIEDHKFSSVHANRLSDSSSTTQIFLCRSPPCDDRGNLYKVCEIKLNNNNIDGVVEEFSTAPKNETPYKYIRLAGSSNGVLCLVCRNFDIHKKYMGMLRNFILWNPLYKNYHCLPPLPPCTTTKRSKNNYLYTYGFGFDTINNDYKVLCFQRGRYDLYARAMVYSQKSKTWRSIDKFPINATTRDGVLYGGSLHWVSTEYDLIAFDLASEQFKSFSHSFIGLRLRHVGILRDGRLYVIARESCNYVFRIMVNYECCVVLRLTPGIEERFHDMEAITYVKSPRGVVMMHKSGDKNISELVLYGVEKESIIQSGDMNVFFLRQVFPYIQTLELY